MDALCHTLREACGDTNPLDVRSLSISHLWSTVDIARLLDAAMYLFPHVEALTIDCPLGETPVMGVLRRWASQLRTVKLNLDLADCLEQVFEGLAPAEHLQSLRIQLLPWTLDGPEEHIIKAKNEFCKSHPTLVSFQWPFDV